MTEAIAICRHCIWGQHRDDIETVIEACEEHLETGHDVDLRLYNPDVESPITLGKDDARLTHVEESGEFK